MIVVVAMLCIWKVDKKKHNDPTLHYATEYIIRIYLIYLSSHHNILSVVELMDIYRNI